MHTHWTDHTLCAQIPRQKSSLQYFCMHHEILCLYRSTCSPWTQLSTVSLCTRYLPDYLPASSDLLTLVLHVLDQPSKASLENKSCQVSLSTEDSYLHKQYYKKREDILDLKLLLTYQKCTYAVFLQEIATPVHKVDVKCLPWREASTIVHTCMLKASVIKMTCNQLNEMKSQKRSV